MDRKKIAGSVGVSPYNRYSGKMKGMRAIWGGCGDVSAVFYIATLVAVRLNPSLREFHQRLRRAGKSPQVALTAFMRKLIVILNAMLKNESPCARNVTPIVGGVSS